MTQELFLAIMATFLMGVGGYCLWRDKGRGDWWTVLSLPPLGMSLVLWIVLAIKYHDYLGSAWK